MPTAKEQILTKVRNALITTTEQPFEEVGRDFFEAGDESLAIQFAQEFTKVQGQFVYCDNMGEAMSKLTSLADEKKWKCVHCWNPNLQRAAREYNFNKISTDRDLDKSDAGLAQCEALIARTGSILLSSSLPAGRTLSIFPPVQIIMASAAQLVADIDDGLNLLKKKYQGNLPSMINLATGPSRTADIEKTLVLGAHGPGEVYVFLIEDWD